MDLAMAVLAMLVLDTMARGLLMPSLRLKLMLVFSMEPMAMVPVLDMLDLDIPVLDMLDMVVMDLAMAVLAMVVLATMARDLLMLSLRLKLMLVCTMEDMAMVPVLDMLGLDMDIPVLDMLDMVDMDLDTVLDMDVPSMVKQLSSVSKSSKVICLLFSALL